MIVVEFLKEAFEQIEIFPKIDILNVKRYMSEKISEFLNNKIYQQSY